MLAKRKATFTISTHDTIRLRASKSATQLDIVAAAYREWRAGKPLEEANAKTVGEVALELSRSLGIPLNAKDVKEARSRAAQFRKQANRLVVRLPSLRIESEDPWSLEGSSTW